MNIANAILPIPYFIIETSSPVEVNSFPKMKPQIHLRAPATGTSARALSPVTPSANVSTVRPETKARSIATTGLYLVGMRRMAQGRMLSVRNVLTCK